MIRKRARTPEPPVTVKTTFGTIPHTNAASDLFATMLRSVRMAEKRIAEEKRNGRTHEQTPAERD